MDMSIKYLFKILELNFSPIFLAVICSALRTQLHRKLMTIVFASARGCAATVLSYTVAEGMEFSVLSSKAL